MSYRISANEEAMEVNVDENNNVPEEKIHYFGCAFRSTLLQISLLIFVTHT